MNTLFVNSCGNKYITKPKASNKPILEFQKAVADDLEDFDSQMVYFYISPNAEAFKLFQIKAEQLRSTIEGSGNIADIITAVMIARISEKYGWPIETGHFGEIAKEIVKGKSRLAKYVLDETCVEPFKLDIWWASFFATGDEKFLYNIFKYAGLNRPTEGDKARMQVIGAATWSFKANCRQHKKVLQFAKRKLDFGVLSEYQEGFIQECIEYASEKNIEESSTPDRKD